MAKKLHFEFDFEDSGPNSINYNVSGPPSQIASTGVENGVPVLYVNKGACRFLAELFARLALGTHRDGFHLHLGENFDPDGEEMIRVVIDSRRSEQLADHAGGVKGD